LQTLSLTPTVLPLVLTPTMHPATILPLVLTPTMHPATILPPAPTTLIPALALTLALTLVLTVLMSSSWCPCCHRRPYRDLVGRSAGPGTAGSRRLRCRPIRRC
jgi:hypothetical protein